jgi:nucleotide-binding universal stress UspA family protein
MFERILVGMDGSQAAVHALEQALDLAILTGGSVHVISVEEHLPAYAATVGEVDEERRHKNHYFQRIHADALRLAAAKGVAVTVEIVPGHAADVIVRIAKQRGSELIVLGHAGHSRVHNLLLGSTADRVTEHASCPVLVVR